MNINDLFRTKWLNGLPRCVWHEKCISGEFPLNVDLHYNLYHGCCLRFRKLRDGWLNITCDFKLNSFQISLLYLHQNAENYDNLENAILSISFFFKSFRCSYWEIVPRGHSVFPSTILRDLGIKHRWQC